jgi:hypothetical protein
VARSRRSRRGRASKSPRCVLSTREACCYAQAAVTYRQTNKVHPLHLLHLLHATAEIPLCWIQTTPMRGAILHFQFTAINEFEKFFLKIRDGGVFEASKLFC